MKINKFDIERGIYNFELTDLDTDFHSHPVIEIVLAINGSFTLETPNSMYRGISFAIIDSNIEHRLVVDACTIKLLMIESYNSLFDNFLSQKSSIILTNGIFTESVQVENNKLVNQILIFAENNRLRKTKDERVDTCLDILSSDNLDYKRMMQELTSRIYLSESRLSHIFKSEIGISLKKYLVWSKLKRTMHLMLNENINLLEASFKSGFYDQAHLSKGFKKMFGVSPSKEYNSRTLQF